MDLWYVTGRQDFVLQVAARTWRATSSSPGGCCTPGSRCAAKRPWWSWGSTNAAAPAASVGRNVAQAWALQGRVQRHPEQGRVGKGAKRQVRCQPLPVGRVSRRQLSAVMGRSTRQGLPTATTPAGMSLVTTDPAPMTLLSPMVTPGQMTTLPPIQTLLPMRTGLPNSTP